MSEGRTPGGRISTPARRGFQTESQDRDRDRWRRRKLPRLTGSERGWRARVGFVAAGPLAGALGSSANRLTGLRTASFSTNIVVAMCVVRWLDVPAATFVFAADW